MSIAEEESGNPPCGGYAFHARYFMFIQFAADDTKDVDTPAVRVIRATVTSKRSVRCVTRLISQAAKR